MTLDLVNESGKMSDFNFHELFSMVIEAASDYVDCPYEVVVNMLLTDDAAIQEINCDERNIDRPTDVLSFPMIEYEKAGDFSLISEEDMSFFDPDSGELLLGDIVISIDTAIRQAENYNHSFVREVAFLCAHSMLHLFGYDHEEESERLEMERMQEEILKGINITRNYE